TRRASSKIEIQRALQEKLAGFDVATDGLAAVVAVDACWPIDKADSQDRLLENQALPFQIFFTSLVHSVPVEADPEEIYRDLYRINDTRVPNYLTRERKRVLAEAWAGTIETLAAHAADRVVGYDQLAAHLIKLRSPATRKGSFGVGYLGGENGVPWHRTGALVDGNVSGDMGFELMRNGFSPVYSDVLSPGPGAKQRQPFFMVPAAALNAGTVDRQLLSGMRMRKK
ncbi:MAG: hypothetical protein HOQ05_11465, partial [Corynebacteriales bacterium]|nr:hypothetical protein [Mycobacteriales bacterium]